MALVTGSWLLDILIFVSSLLYLLHWYISTSYNYFKDRGIPYLKPLPFVGYIGVLTKSQTDVANALYNSFPGERFFGYFQAKIPTLLVRDPELINRILVKDFAHFHDRGFPSSDHDPMSKNLFNLRGHGWRVMRQKLMPTFSTGKIKIMFDQVIKCGDNLIKEIDKISLSKEAVEARLLIGTFPTEVIGSTAFGLDFGRNNPQTIEFRVKIGKIFEFSLFQVLKFLFIMGAPKIVRLLKIKALPQEANNYFMNLTKTTKEYRKKNNIKRNDYFQLLLTLQEAEESGKAMTAADMSEEDAIINQMEFAPESSQPIIGSKMFTDEGITAQSFVFLTAGTDSVTSTISFTLYHLAKSPQIQRRLKEEVVAVLAKHGGWTYPAIKDMTYLDQVIQETQRMYPVVSLMTRECTIPYAIPDSNSVIDKGTLVTIPILGIQRDPKYYPSPEVYDPDRFANNNFKPKTTFLPFGDGPRICIAMRFAIVEVKVSLAKVFAQYSVELSSKTKEPFTYERKSFFPRPVGGIWVNFKRDSQKSCNMITK